MADDDSLIFNPPPRPARLPAFNDAYWQGLREGEEKERQRILAIIEKEPWEVYGDDYYTTYDAQASIARLKALIEKETPS